MLSQHSRSQALVKEEDCDRRGEPTLNLAILIEMKPERKPLGRNPLSDTPYQNPGTVLNGQGPGRHPLSDASCRDLGMVRVRRRRRWTVHVLSFGTQGQSRIEME